MTRVALVGCGGLGVPAAWTLALGGQRAFRLIDADVVEESNLHRQVLYTTPDIGLPKAARLAEFLRAHFGADVQTAATRLDAANAEALLDGCAAVLEGSDVRQLIHGERDSERESRTGGAVEKAR